MLLQTEPEHSRGKSPANVEPPKDEKLRSVGEHNFINCGLWHLQPSSIPGVYKPTNIRVGALVIVGVQVYQDGFGERGGFEF